MPRTADNPLLLTPGPVSVSKTTREVMLRDRAGWAPEVAEDIRFCRDYLVRLIGGGNFTAVPVPGSATYANEALLATLVPPDGKVLIHSNGVYGDRLAEIAAALGVDHAVVRTPPFEPASASLFAAEFQADPAITHAMVVHCETSVGVLNPIEPIAAVCRRFGKSFMIDAVASFGAEPIDAAALDLVGISISSNKCLQGVPGLGWALVQRHALEEARGQAKTLSLDLWDQNRQMDQATAFRFTPPTQILAAFAQACREHEQEGGIEARGARYRRNWTRLVGGMRQMGFATVVPDDFASPIVATFKNPDDPNFSFERLYEGMERRGFIIFPGRLAIADTFRIGCMGDVHDVDIGEALEALADTLTEMKVTSCGRQATSARLVSPDGATAALELRLDDVLATLLRDSGASRTTLRIDDARRGWTVDLVCAEATLPTVKSLRGDGSIDQRAAATVVWMDKYRRNLIQPDIVNNPDPAPPPALMSAYAAKAQMLAPLFNRDGTLQGWISAHYVEGTYHFSEADIAALERAAAEVKALTGI